MARLPETVKIARVGLSATTNFEGDRAPINLGRDEVVLLMSLYYWWSAFLSAGENIINIGLWKRTDTDPPAVLTDHTDLIWSTRHVKKFVTESVSASGNELIHFPKPLILIRPPRVIASRAIATSATVDVRLFYQILKVSKDQMAMLMMKDHA